MKFLILSLLLAFATAQYVEIDPFLTSNAFALVGEFPSAVFLRAPGTPRQPICGGTIIDSSHILTSAQCVTNNQNQIINPFWYTVTAGDLNVLRGTSRRVTRRISRVFVHPNFNAFNRNNDLAVLRLETPLPEFHNTVEPAILNNVTLATATPCRLAAWGRATAPITAALQPDLRVLNAPIIDRVPCNAGAVHNNNVLLTHFCAGSIPTTNPASGACGGNIGSGLYCNDRLAGVLSFGTSCGAANQPGVYVDIVQYTAWINSQLLRTDNPQPGTLP